MSVDGFYPILLTHKGKWAGEQNLRKEEANCRDLRFYYFYVSKISKDDLYLCFRPTLGFCKEVIRTLIFQSNLDPDFV